MSSITTGAAQLAKMIDHTLLKANATQSEIEALCDEAISLGVCTVCINPFWIPLAASRLAGSSVMPITVVGFPLGATTTAQKAEEAKRSIADGAREIDMVLNVGALLSGRDQDVKQDIAAVRAACGDIPLKVILETAYLNTDQIYQASQWSAKEGAAFVKTSTGFASRGASIADIQTMRQALQAIGALPKVGIKASGGIRDFATAQAMVEAGATRIGASATATILSGVAAASTLGY